MSTTLPALNRVLPSYAKHSPSVRHCKTRNVNCTSPFTQVPLALTGAIRAPTKTCGAATPRARRVQMPVRRALLEVNLRPRKFSSHLPVRGASPIYAGLAQNFVKWPQMSCPHCSWHAEGLDSAGAIVECPPHGKCLPPSAAYLKAYVSIGGQASIRLYAGAAGTDRCYTSP